ncbi:PIR Superfamily Protein [Plasmodium ovale wallikeri]|uniref:PIR Superfamily Protein n=1 Tax=Plasmodium ovale wallikeri TaxID=864142 RepID=A0A1A9AQN4_PLAOA|nr:PIR Superfamily Protein [Plasmodium ovale wallikeri]SBT59539.1 PIR Superfamily Protein [Plasmodium ovale wallikeri]
MNTEKWKRDYPFFDTIWKLYDQFDKTVSNEGNVLYDSICQSIIENISENNGKHIDICIKLMRNLWSLSNTKYSDMLNSEHCTNLNIWLYNEIKKHSIPEETLKEIFEATNTITLTLSNYYKCTYYPFNKDIEPENLLKLLNFEANINIIKRVLEDKGNTHYCQCKNYVYECANIFRTLNSKYCPSGKANKENICSKLKTFQSSYSISLYDKPEIKANIPSLDSPHSETLIDCSHKEQVISLQDPKDESVSSNVPFNVPAFVGIMGGLFPLLLIVYKYTTLRPKLLSIIKNRRIDNNLDEEEIRELPLYKSEKELIISDEVNYNMTYLPAANV